MNMRMEKKKIKEEAEKEKEKLGKRRRGGESRRRKGGRKWEGREIVYLVLHVVGEYNIQKIANVTTKLLTHWQSLVWAPWTSPFPCLRPWFSQQSM